MADATSRRAPTAEQRLAGARQGRARVRRERLLRELAGERARELLRVTPVLFLREGDVLVRALTADRERVIDVLSKEPAVFALDTAARLRHGVGILRSEDVHAYVADAATVDALAAAGLVATAPSADRALVRAWEGDPRLFACVVHELPEFDVVGGRRVVTPSQLRAELLGVVGLRFDLFSRLDAAG